MGEPKRNQIFISYAHEDTHWREEFERMLAPARERGLVDTWSDGEIVAGENWYESIKRALAHTRLGLLLVSNHFLQSQFIKELELASLLRLAKGEGVAIRWVPISPTLYQHTPFAQIKASSNPDQPLDQLKPSDQLATIQKICQELVQYFGTTCTVSNGRRESLRNQVQARLDGKYTIIDEVAAGKFSIVYRAERNDSKRTVGIKTLVASDLDDRARRAFIEGAKHASELRSPAFIKVLDQYMDESPEFLVSEFVAAEPLSNVLRRYPDGLPLDQVKAILVHLAQAIEEAHERGWRRGEMCPSDLLIEQSGLPRISAFDFSNVLREEALFTGNYLNDRESLSYMTPERFLGYAPTPLTDQYSLALIATELLGGPSIPQVVRPCDLEGKRQLFDDLQAGTGAWAARSPEFAGLIGRMLRVAPEQRWASMGKVRSLLSQIEVFESPAERDRKFATASYVRLQAQGIHGEIKLFGNFYDNLFAVTDDVAHRFQSTDMERQYRMLNRAIDALLEFRPESPDRSPTLTQIASRHARLGLGKRHYDLFLEAFLKTIQELGENDAATLAAWRATLQPGIDFLCQSEAGMLAGANVAERAGGGEERPQAHEVQPAVSSWARSTREMPDASNWDSAASAAMH